LWLQRGALLADRFAVWGAWQPFAGGGTYKVGVGGALELLLGFGTDGSVCRASVRRRATQRGRATYRGRKSPPTPG
jgi:hypothetical protein